MAQLIAEFLFRVAHWLDGSGYNYDPFDHGYREGMKRAAHEEQTNDRNA